MAVNEPLVRPTRRIAKRAAIAVDSVLPSGSGSVVLAYHRVGGRTASPVDLSTAMFRRQLAHLAAVGEVASLDSMLSTFATGTCNRSPATVLTFDDGTADFIDIVLPILVEFSLPATLYVATGFVDSRERYPNDGNPVSWAGLREAVSTGLVTIGAHTHTHVLLDRCDVATAQHELDRCNTRIADELGVVAEHFAYPKAVVASSPIEREVKRRYRSAAVAGTRPNRSHDFDQYRVRRSPIQVADGWNGFVRKAAGGMWAEDDVRRVINLIRYRGEAR